MTSSIGSGLARVTIAAPSRRVDVALPEQQPTAELLPGLLRHAGEDLADVGQEHGGWVLRRSDGSMIDPTQTLAAQSVRDGEILHLTRRYEQWPEMDYDDVVDAIATEARRRVRTWNAAATRRTAIVVGAVAAAIMLVVILSTGPWWHSGGSWTRPATVTLVVAALLVLGGIALARALGDAGTGAAVGAMALFFAFAGGLTVFNGHHSLLGVQSQQLLAGCAVLFAVALLGYGGIADRTQFFIGGMHVGLFGLIAGALGTTSLSPSDIAGILVTAVIALAPMLPLLSIRLGKLPVPALPASTEELLADQPKTPLPRVYASVRRSDELLTGMLIGNATVAVLAQLTLALNGRQTALILIGLTTTSLLLQSRLFPTLRHRAPLLAAGVAGAACLVLRGMSRSADFRVAVMVPALVVLVGLVLAAGRHYQHRPPGPYLGRIADVLDVLIIVAAVPVTCLLVGFVGYVRHLYH